MIHQTAKDLKSYQERCCDLLIGRLYSRNYRECNTLVIYCLVLELWNLAFIKKDLPKNALQGIICSLYMWRKEKHNRHYLPGSLSPQLCQPPGMSFICALTRQLYTWHTCCRGSCHLGHARDHFLVCRKDFHFAKGSEIHCMYPKGGEKARVWVFFINYFVRFLPSASQ